MSDDVKQKVDLRLDEAQRFSRLAVRNEQTGHADAVASNALVSIAFSLEALVILAREELLEPVELELTSAGDS